MTNIAKHITILTVMIVPLVGCSAVSRTEPMESVPKDRRFYELLNLSHSNYEPLKFDALAAKSDMIAIGTIVAVGDGRAMDFSEGPSNPSYTSVLEIELSDVIKGNSDKSVAYVEIDRAPAITSKDLHASLPGVSMLVFLRSAPDGKQFLGMDVTDASAKVRGAEPLMRFTTPQGMLIEEVGGRTPRLRTPLETDTKLFDADDDGEADEAPATFALAIDALEATF